MTVKADRLGHLPRPWTAVLVGGRTRWFPFDAKEGRKLGVALIHEVRHTGGSVLVTTSRRTDPVVSKALARALEGFVFFHRWSPGQTDNPYLAFLALADQIVVTADSASMLAEACATGKPVRIYGQLTHPTGLRRRIRTLVADLAERSGNLPRLWPGDWLRRIVARLADGGLVRHPLDHRRWHEALVARGEAGRFGGAGASPIPRTSGDLAAVRDAARALVSRHDDPLRCAADSVANCGRASVCGSR